MDKVETTLKDLVVYRDEEPGENKGHVNVQIRLLRGETVISVAMVRVYFTREDVPLDALIDSALSQAQRSLHRMAALTRLAPLAEDRPPLWLE